MQEKQLKKSTEYIKEAWRIYTKKENFIYFARIMAVLTIFSISIGFISGYFFPENYLQNGDFSNIPLLVGYLFLSLVSIIVTLWSQSTNYLSILKIRSDEKEILKLGFKKIGKLFAVSFVIGLIVMLGAILLIVPAIIFGVWYSFSIWLVFDKNMSIKESLSESKLMVKGIFWKVIGRSVVIGVFSFIVTLILALIPYLGNVLITFIAPLFLLPYYLMYKDLLPNS